MYAALLSAKNFTGHDRQCHELKIECEIVIPPCGDKMHWVERLGLDCPGDEKDALIRNAPELKNYFVESVGAKRSDG